MLRFQKNITLAAIWKKKQFSTFLNRNFLKQQFLNNLFFAIWFKMTFFVYEIVIPNTPLISGLIYVEFFSL
jgi:hypothetical protein